MIKKKITEDHHQMGIWKEDNGRVTGKSEQHLTKRKENLIEPNKYKQSTVRVKYSMSQRPKIGEGGIKATVISDSINSSPGSSVLQLAWKFLERSCQPETSVLHHWSHQSWKKMAISHQHHMQLGMNPQRHSMM